MFLLEILLALALLQLWSGHNPLHRDEWFCWWLDKVDGWALLSRNAYLAGSATIFVPLILMVLVFSFVPGAIGFLISVVTLVYCLGRGEFGSEVQSYNAACAQDNWELALGAASRQGIDHTEIPHNDWPSLHERMLEATAYQGFERLFAVLFWFVFLGPLGALLYRLSFAYSRTKNHEVALHWLWALEWLPARILSASFAITGNFVGCINRWRDKVLCPTSSASKVLSQAVMGALSVDDELVQTCDVTQREVAAIKRLYVRTLWLWMALLALWVLFGPAELFS